MMTMCTGDEVNAAGRTGPLMTPNSMGAYWIADGKDYTLYVDGRRRAEVNLDRNEGVIHGRQRWLRKSPQEFVDGSPATDIIADVERRLGFPALAIVNRDGELLHGLREEIQARADLFRNLHLEPSDDPVGDAAEMLELAHGCLNQAAIDRTLCNRGSDSRDFCAKAGNLLKAHGRITAEVAAAIGDAQRALDDAVQRQSDPLEAEFDEAQTFLKRAGGLAELYGERSVSRALNGDSQSGDRKISEDGSRRPRNQRNFGHQF